MKYMLKLHKLQKSFIWFLLFAVSCGCFSCGLMTKVKTVTKTETQRKIKIDTIIHINAIPIKTTEVILHDTATVENETGFARAYYNTTKQKIVLSLLGKANDVPVHAEVTTNTTVKEKEVTKKPNMYLFMILFFLLIWIVIFTYFILKKYVKI
jgi:hypothetical protein